MVKDIIVARPENEHQLDSLKAFLEALKINFDIKVDDRYDSSFVEKIMLSKQQALEGNIRKMDSSEIEQLLGI